MDVKQLTLYVDTKRCMGCRACEIACKMEHDLPAGPRYITVKESEAGQGLNERFEYLPSPCLHCGDAPCIKVCPTAALSKRPDGIVLVDSGKCAGCHKCLWICPVGAPQFGADGHMHKCDLCVRRIDEGMEPACMHACPAEAILCGSEEEISVTLSERYRAIHSKPCYEVTFVKR